MPKYQETWNVSTEHTPGVKSYVLKQLTLRMCMLLALLTGQRGFASVKVGDLKLHDTKCIIHFSDKHKYSRPGLNMEPAEILALSENPKLCLVST